MFTWEANYQLIESYFKFTTNSFLVTNAWSLNQMKHKYYFI